MKQLEARLLLGDCRQELKKIPDNSIDLIFTSPPYADSRKNTYGGVSPDRYVEWFLPISAELLRVLKPSGTFVLNIKEKVVNGERHTYVIELILEMRKQGWLWTEEFIWHKKNSYPGKWPNRFRDSWERLLQFNKNRQFHMYQEEVMAPMGDWVLDPFMGSGTTMSVAQRMERNAIGIEILPEYFDLAQSKVKPVMEMRPADFCVEGSIAWEKLVVFNSGRK